MLPPCEHRGDLLTITAPGSGAVRTVYECDQMHVRGRDLVAQVSAVVCEECGYSNDAFDRGAHYIQLQDNFPTTEEYAERHSACQTCPIRQANFCPRAAGSCSLTRKLEKCDFKCPMGRFGQIERVT